MDALDAIARLEDPVASIADAVARIAVVARGADPTAPVPALGRWKLHDVIAHLGGVEEWAARVVSSRSTDGPGFRKSKLRGDELLDWFAASGAELVDVLRTADPAAPCPNFNPGSPNVIAFWIRRQLHEHLVHASDVERAVGVEPSPIAPATAADGIDEYLDVFVRTRGKQTLVAPLRVVCRDVDRAWLLEPAAKPGRIDVAEADAASGAASDGSAAAAAAEFRGPAMDLLMLMWQRTSVDAGTIDVSGDPDVAASFRP